MITLTADQWRSERSLTLAELEPHAAAGEDRRSRRVIHPIEDFIFEYYSLRPSQLRPWSPGPDVLLLDASPNELDRGRLFVEQDGGLVLPAYPANRRSFLIWLTEYLTAVAARPLALGCFGMHEWAMVY